MEKEAIPQYEKVRLYFPEVLPVPEPCPICGGEAEIRFESKEDSDEADRGFVKCSKCGYEVNAENGISDTHTKFMAINKWNDLWLDYNKEK